MMNGYGGWGMGAWLMMSVITLVVLVAIVVGVVALSRRSNTAAQAPAAAPAVGGSVTALRALDERFARGVVFGGFGAVSQGCRGQRGRHIEHQLA